MFGGGPFGRNPRDFDWHAKPGDRGRGGPRQALFRMIFGLIVLLIVLLAISLLSPSGDSGEPDPRSNDPEVHHRLEAGDWVSGWRREWD